jgi:hypothetical protein
MGRRRPKEGRPIVFFRGIPHEMDEQRCRAALIRCQVDGKLDSIQGMADELEISRSTASRFFGGRPCSLAITLLILDKLGLQFDDVFRPVDLNGT